MPVTEVRLYDANRAAVLRITVPLEQQQRVVPDARFNPHNYTNRVNVASQSSFQWLHGNPASTRFIQLLRGGREDMGTVSPPFADAARWTISGFVLRSGCKGKQMLHWWELSC